MKASLPTETLDFTSYGDGVITLDNLTLSPSLKGASVALIERYFQSSDDDKPKLYRGGDDPRDHDNRKELPQELQTLLTLLDKRNTTRCKSDCSVPVELQPYMGHMTSIIKEKGAGKVELGLINFRDQDKQVEKILKTRNKLIDRVMMIVAGAIALYVIQKIKLAM